MAKEGSQVLKAVDVHPALVNKARRNIVPEDRLEVVLRRSIMTSSPSLAWSVLGSARVSTSRIHNAVVVDRVLVLSCMVSEHILGKPDSWKPC